MTAAFVAGATGFTGRELVRALRARGLRAVAHVRPDSPRLAEWRARLEALGAEVDATAWDAGALSETLRRVGATHVFALLGTTKARAFEAAARGVTESYETVDYGLTRLILDAAVASGLRPRFVYLSSVGVSPRTRNPYLAVRSRFEAELRASGLPFTIARPSFITGPDRDVPRPLERLAASSADAALGVAARLGGRRLADRYRSTTNVALADALVRVALDPAAAGRIVESEALR